MMLLQDIVDKAKREGWDKNLPIHHDIVDDDGDEPFPEVAGAYTTIWKGREIIVLI